MEYGEVTVYLACVCSVAWLASQRASAGKNPGFVGESRWKQVSHDGSRIIQVQKPIKQILAESINRPLIQKRALNCQSNFANRSKIPCIKLLNWRFTS